MKLQTTGSVMSSQILHFLFYSEVHNMFEMLISNVIASLSFMTFVIQCYAHSANVPHHIIIAILRRGEKIIYVRMHKISCKNVLSFLLYY